MNDYDLLLETLKSYNPLYKQIFDKAVPYFKKGREIDLQHTIEIVIYGIEVMEKMPGIKEKESIVIPALILHDIGWFKVPKDILAASWGSGRQDTEGKRIHQKEGSLIATSILEQVKYPKNEIKKISYIVSIHDNIEACRKDILALFVAETDKLIRYTKYGFWILIEIGQDTLNDRVNSLGDGLEKWFSIKEIKEFAINLYAQRMGEVKEK